MSAVAAAAEPPDPFHRPSLPDSLEAILDAARHRIEVTPEELDVARARRDMLAAALLAEFPGSTVYVNGSVAHGDALDPLTDVDLGVVVAEAVDTHGPGKKGCTDLQERAAAAIKRHLRPRFPNLRVEHRARKRSILVRFGDPVTPGQADFTADVIVAVDNTDPDDNRGLWIPRYLGWSRSDPQEHTRLVLAAIAASVSVYARAVRLLKHWNRANGRPLCSWNIKALALDVLDEPRSLLDSLVVWFDHAIASLSVGLTEDPAGVAEQPIGVNKDLTRTQVVDRLENARRLLGQAVEFEAAGYMAMAQEALAKMFNDPQMLPFPDAETVRVEAARKFLADTNAAHRPATKPGAGAGAGAAAVTAPVVNVGTSGRPGRPVRSWSEPPLFGTAR